MTVTRRNIVTDQSARDRFVDGVLALKAEFLGTSTTDLGIPGPAQQVSTVRPARQSRGSKTSARAPHRQHW